MRWTGTLAAGWALWWGAVATGAEAPAPPGHLKAAPEAMQWWRDAKLGLFVCWGPVSLTGREIGWSRGAPSWGRRKGVRGGKGPTPAAVYDKLYTKWRPDQFDAREWVQVAQDAGCRYIIFLVKHHDGFCLYDTKLTDHRSTGPASAWKVDVMKAIADACHASGIKLFVYYSQPDWHHPDYLGEHHGRYIAYLHGQVRELLAGYGRIDGLWFDGLGHPAKDWDAEKLFRMARALQPHLIINNRCGLPGDFDTPEQRIGTFRSDRPWESCITLGTQWAWKPKDRIKSLKECIDLLVRCAGGDGNLALNTNPMPDGRVEPRQAARFREIGAWLQQHGESIYGTRGGPFLPTRGFASTHKGHTVYLHILRWPGSTITLPPIERRVVSHRVLTGGAATVKQTDAGIEVAVPKEQRHPLDTIVALTLDGPAADVKPGKLASGSVAAGKPALASNTFQNSPTYAPSKAFDDDFATRWGCDWGTKSCWLAVDLGKPTTLGRALLSEPYGRVRQFALERREGEKWKAFARGTTLGDRKELAFPPITARHIRLNLLRCTDGPSIWEFQLFPPGK
ncbi:alpha-L-fucosidase [bacterium]|nr:alpha-L-fucosidase [bacterium]